MDLDGVAIETRRSARAKRLQIRIDSAKRQAILVIPSGATLTDAEKFARAHEAWIRRELSSLPCQVPFVPGAIVPIEGEPTELVFDPALGTKVERTTAALVVGGRPVGFERRVLAWLKQYARARFLRETSDFAYQLGHTVPSLSLRDSRTRWGSCSSSGRMSLSWRLILAPPGVGRYVVAHESAHLVHMNHGPKFWATVDQLFPEHGPWRHWLRRHGDELRRYG